LLGLVLREDEDPVRGCGRRRGVLRGRGYDVCYERPPALRRRNSAPVLRRLLREADLHLLRGGQGVGVTAAPGTDIAFDKVFGLRAIPTSTRRVGRTEANIRGGERLWGEARCRGLHEICARRYSTARRIFTECGR
jgi:hypothetical protein